MTGKSEIKKSLNHAVDQLPQPSLKKISETPVEKMKEMDSYTYQEPVRHKFNFSSFGRIPAYRFAVACICLVFCLTGGWYTHQNLMTDTIIDVDVNPSFEIAINRRERILSLTALNADAAEILEKRDYRGWELEAAVESLCTVIEENGYLNSDRRTILITVENKNQKRSDQLKEQLTVYIRDSLKEKRVMPRIVTQNRKSEKTVVNDAQNYDISPGKLQFIRSMAERYPDLEENALAKLSMEELYAIVRLREEKVPDWFEIEERDWDDDEEESEESGETDDEEDDEDDDGKEAYRENAGHENITDTKAGNRDFDDEDDDRGGKAEKKVENRDSDDNDDDRDDDPEKDDMDDDGDDDDDSDSDDDTDSDDDQDDEDED